MFQQHVARTSHQIQVLTRAVETMSHGFNPGTRDSMIKDITDKLQKMSAHELLKIKSMFDIWTGQ